MVGHALGTRMVKLGNEVRMGSRTAGNEKAMAWAAANGPDASAGTFADAAAFGEIIFNCTSGLMSLEALKLAGADHLKGKILVDVANPLDYSGGMPPSLGISNTDSLGERIQKAFPDARVVKTLNTVNCNVMVNPILAGGESDMFISGNDEEAKQQVVKILTKWFGWKSVIDLGDITGARSQEMMMPIWIRLMIVNGTPNFGFRIIRGQ